MELDNRSGRPPTAPTNTEIRRISVETTFSFSFTGLTYRATALINRTISLKKHLKSFLFRQSFVSDNVCTDYVIALVAVCTAYCALQIVIFTFTCW